MASLGLVVVVQVGAGLGVGAGQGSLLEVRLMGHPRRRLKPGPDLLHRHPELVSEEALALLGVPLAEQQTIGLPVEIRQLSLVGRDSGAGVRVVGVLHGLHN